MKRLLAGLTLSVLMVAPSLLMGAELYVPAIPPQWEPGTRSEVYVGNAIPFDSTLFLSGEYKQFYPKTFSGPVEATGISFLPIEGIKKRA